MGSGDPRLAAISLVELLRRGPRNGRGSRLGLLGGRGGPNGRMGDAPPRWFADRRVHRRPYWDRVWPAGGLATPPTPIVTSLRRVKPRWSPASGGQAAPLPGPVRPYDARWLLLLGFGVAVR